MKQRTSIWKDANRSAVRLNSKISQQKQLPAKFAPRRDYSRSSDKLFQRSISLDQTIHNKTREDETGIMAKTVRLSIATKGNDDADKRTSEMFGHPINFRLKKIECACQEPDNRKSLTIVTELKKQYMSFKRNILVELDRQKQMVQRLIKEIVLTMEFQLNKIVSLYTSKEEKVAKIQKIKQVNATDLKDIEEWKLQLKNISIAQQDKNHGLLLPVKQKDQCQQRTQQNILAPPTPLLDFANYQSSLISLKIQVTSMDQLISSLSISKKTAKE